MVIFRAVNTGVEQITASNQYVSGPALSTRPAIFVGYKMLCGIFLLIMVTVMVLIIRFLLKKGS